MIGLIVLGLAFVFFLVIAVFAAKNWHVGHVVSLSFLFLFTLLTLFMTATLLRTNAEYQPKFERANTDLEREIEKTERLIYGNSAEPAGEGTVVGEQTLAKVEQISRGRVWRNVFAIPGGGNGVVAINMRKWNNDGCLRVGKEEDELSDEAIEPIAAEEAGAGEAEDAVELEGTHGVAVGQYVYAFKDFPIAKMTPDQKKYYFGSLGGDGDDSFANADTKGICRVPIAYLGKFLVVDANANAIQLQFQGAPDQGQIAQLQSKTPWVLYERLPTDVAQLFGDTDGENLAKLLPLKWFVDFGIPLQPAAYQAMIQEYAQDGKPFNGRVNDPFRLQVEVKFLKEYTQIVDLQVEGELPPADQPFNVEGHAQVRNMLQGEPTVFQVDDTSFFDSVTADRLVKQGIAQRIGEPTYRRQLRSFEFSLGDYQDRFSEVADEIRGVQARVQELTASLNSLQTQIDKHREEVQQLEQDQQGFEAEKVELQKYRQQLKSRYDYLEDEVQSLTRGNVANAGEFATKQSLNRLALKN